MTEHEIFGMRRRGSHASLLVDEDAPPLRRSVPRSSPKIRDFLRYFRLQLAALIFHCYPGLKWDREQPKVAIHRDRFVAVLHSLLHIVPIGGAATLMFLHFSRYWVGYEEAGDSHILQFAAKLHELAMQASIIEVMLCIVRTGLTTGFLPLGALSGAVQATQISYLWSLDFVSLMTTSAVRGWRKVLLVVAIPALITLTALVGPSSAVLMIPRQGSPYTARSRTYYLPISSELLYPSVLGSTRGESNETNGAGDIFPRVEEFAAVQANQRLYQSDRFDDSTHNLTVTTSQLSYVDNYFESTRLMRASFTSYESTESPGNPINEVYATIPTRLVEALLLDAHEKDFESRNSTRLESNATWAMTTEYPVVHTICHDIGNPDTELTAESKAWYVKDGWSGVEDLSNLGTYAEGISDQGEELQNYRVDFPPVWMPSPEADSNSVIGLFFSYTYFNLGTRTSDPGTLMYALENNFEGAVRATLCKLSAHWITGEMQWIDNSGISLVQTSPSSTTQAPNRRPITINVADIESMQTANFSYDIMVKSKLPDPGTLYLAGSLVLAISEVAKVDVTSEEFENVTDPNSVDLTSGDVTALQYTKTVYGYGYGVRTTSIYLSLTVMIVYCTITLLYIGYTLITGLTSTAWSSATELVALALQSSKPDVIGNSAVGIDSIKSFSQGVGIRVNTDNELEIVFVKDNNYKTRTWKRIEYSQQY